MRVAAPAIALLLIGCGSASEEPRYDGPPIPWAYRALPEIADPADNPSTPEKVELGRLLFYDPVLSADRAVACATCHSEIWGMSDGLARSIGIGGKGPTGPGRVGDNVTRRNAQTLWNVALREPLFWDGRTHTLEEQVLAPLAEPTELARDPDEVVAELSAIPEYVALFRAAFPEQPSIDVTSFTRAIAAFERTIVARSAPYDRYTEGDAGALSEETIRGVFLFAEAGCSSCHAAPSFDSERFANRGIGGEGDLGRFEVTGNDADRGAFRVPTLRNVRESGPFFHDGSVTELEEAVRHEVSVSVAEGSSRSLEPEEIAAIVTFLDKALTDLSGEPERPKQVPSGLPVPVDGFRIPR